MVVRVVAVLPLLATVALYVLWLAQRLDGLHRRVDSAARGLDAQLRRRSVAASALADLAPDAAAHGSGERVTAGQWAALDSAARRARAVTGLGHDREAAESALSRAIDGVTGRATPGPLLAELAEECARAQIARVFYNDTVRDALVVRDRRLVRWARLAGTAAHPAYLEMVDAHRDNEFSSERQHVTIR